MFIKFKLNKPYKHIIRGVNIMKIVILTGSYNLHGTSNTLVDEFIKGAKENSHEIVRFDTAHL